MPKRGALWCRGLDGWTLAILTASLLLQCVYLSYTSYVERNADGDAHLSYVMLVLQQGPFGEKACSVCHHPPLYYAIGAAVVQVASWLHWANAARVLQFWSLVYSSVYLWFGALIVREFVVGRGYVWFGTALFAFWPSTIMGGCRLHNDSLANPLVLGSVYFLIRAIKTHNGSSFTWASALLTLGMLTKFSCSVVLPLWLVVASMSLRASTGKRWLATHGAACVMVFGVVAYWSARFLAQSWCQRFFVGRACVAASRDLPNSAGAFLSLHVGEFVSRPYFVVTGDSHEAGLFWHCLLKSSLFGIYRSSPDPELASRINSHIAIGMNCLLLLMLAWTLALALRRPRAWYRAHWSLLLVSATSVAFLMAFRASLPNAYHNDFRHVQGLLLCGLTLFVGLLEQESQLRRWSSRIGLALGMSMIVSSVLHFVPKPPTGEVFGAYAQESLPERDLLGRSTSPPFHCTSYTGP